MYLKNEMKKIRRYKEYENFKEYDKYFIGIKFF